MAWTFLLFIHDLNIHMTCTIKYPVIAKVSETFTGQGVPVTFQNYQCIVIEPILPQMQGERRIEELSVSLEVL